MILRSPCQSRRPSRTGVRLSRVFSTLLWSVACCALFSCGGGEDAKSETKSAERQLSRAEKALQKAEELGVKSLFEDDFEKYVEDLAKARETLEDGKIAKAERALKKVSRRIKSLISKAEKAGEDVKKLEELRKEVVAARLDATAKKARTDAPREFAAAEKLFKKFKAVVKDPSKAKTATRYGRQAREGYEDAVEQAKQNTTVKKKAVGSRQAMLVWKEKATAIGAEEKSASDWLYASRKERGGETELAEGLFFEAQESFESAETAYSQAFTNAKTMDEIAANTGNTGAGAVVTNPEDVALAADEDSYVDDEDSYVDDVALAADEDSYVDTGEADGSGESFDAETVPPPVDPSSPDAFIEVNLDKLSLAADEYDPVSGEITLDYTFGPDKVKKEYKPLVLKSKKYISFWDPIVPDKQLARDDPELAVSFGGNSQGSFTLPVPLMAPLTMEWTASIGVMDNGGSMGPIVFAQDAGRKYYWADFATFRRVLAGNTKSSTKRIPKKFKRSAARWFVKFRNVKMRLTVEKDEKKEDRFIMSIFYDLGEEDGEYPLNRQVVKEDFAKGLIGWRWRRTKFLIRKLRVVAQLDKTEALRILKDKLGVEAPETGSTGPKKTQKEAGTGKKVADAKAKRDSDAKTTERTGTSKESEEFDF